MQVQTEGQSTSSSRIPPLFADFYSVTWKFLSHVARGGKSATKQWGDSCLGAIPNDARRPNWFYITLTSEIQNMAKNFYTR